VKTLITGSTGLLGQALSSLLAPSCELVGLSRHEPAAGPGGRHVVCDLLDASRTASLLREVAPDFVLHTQAMSDVDRCEQDPQLARAQNAQATANLMEAAAPVGALVVHVSTDYVFDGEKGAAYDERDAPNPISVYGRSKLEGERIVLRYPRAVIVRPSTLFGPGRMNFCDHIVMRGRAGQPVEAFTDQITSPTSTADLAQGLSELATALARASDPSWPRVYHLANAGWASRVQFAEHVVGLIGASPELIRRIPMAAQQRPAPRPRNSSLTTIHLGPLIGRTLRGWQDAVECYLRERGWLN
jgi:dTDP-4-dehydrorhamnose reductase